MSIARERRVDRRAYAVECPRDYCRAERWRACVDPTGRALVLPHAERDEAAKRAPASALTPTFGPEFE